MNSKARRAARAYLDARQSHHTFPDVEARALWQALGLSAGAIEIEEADELTTSLLGIDPRPVDLDAEMLKLAKRVVTGRDDSERDAYVQLLERHRDGELTRSDIAYFGRRIRSRRCEASRHVRRTGELLRRLAVLSGDGNRWRRPRGSMRSGRDD